MRKLCTILTALALVVLCIVLMPTEAQAAEITASGTCSDNLTWTLDDAGTLTISGTGAMDNYIPGMYIPWMDYAEDVTTVIIKDGVTSIGSRAFSDFVQLSGVAIPLSVTDIGANAFANCPNLTKVAYSGTDTQWSSINLGSGNAYMVNVWQSQIASGTCGDVLIWTLNENGTLRISGSDAMKNYSSTGSPWYSWHSFIKNVVIESGVTSIGMCAFYDCSNLTSITIPEGITSIGSSAFYNCSSLTSITIPKGVTSIGSSAFYNCSNLTNVIIPDGVTSIGNDTFYRCSSLISVTIPDGVTSIGSYAFQHCISLTSIIIPNGVTSIGNRAFCSCDSLTSVIIPGTVTNIEYLAFGYCDNLRNVTFNDGATYIGRYMFSDCTQLTSVSVPESITNIGEHPFSGCNELTYNLYGNGKYLGNSANPYILLMGTQASEDLIIPNGVKCIYPLFSRFGTITNVYISDLAAWCDISFDIYLEYWDFMDPFITYGNPLCYAQNLYINGELVTELVIPKGVTKINDYAFVKCPNISSVVIPTSVTSIGEEAFVKCNLTNVTYCGTNTQWNNISISTGNTSLTNATRTSHNWSSTSVNKSPTYTAMGTSTYTCISCSAEKTEFTPAKFYGTSVNLGNTLDMYFGFYTGLVDENGTVKFVREFADGTTETTTAPITSFKKNNSVYDITYTGLAAKEMCDTIHVYVYNGEGTLVGQHSDSIRSYILRQLREKNYGQEFRTLCVDLLNYGAAAQSTFGYNATDLANKDLTAKELAEGTQTVASYVNKQTVTGTSAAFYGTAYILETKISMNMAVRGSYFGEGCYALVSYTDHTGTQKNIRLESKKNNSVYEFTLNEIVVADGRCLLTVEFYKADGTKVVTVQDSMESYTARNAEYYPLAEKMLAFSDSAYKYLH